MVRCYMRCRIYADTQLKNLSSMAEEFGLGHFVVDRDTLGSSIRPHHHVYFIVDSDSPHGIGQNLNPEFVMDYAIMDKLPDYIRNKFS